MTLNNKQKKILTISIITTSSLIFLGGLIVGIYLIASGNIQAGTITTTITNFISPTTLLGIVIKYLMNKYFNNKNKRDVKEILQAHGIEEKPKPKPKKQQDKNINSYENSGYII